MQAIFACATGRFEHAFARWVRRCQTHFAYLVLRLSYEQAVVKHLSAKPAKSLLLLELVYGEEKGSFHILSVNLGTFDEIEDEKLRATLLACSARPLPGSTDSRRRVWAVTFASCTCRGYQLSRVVPMTWVPHTEGTACQPAQLSTLPDSAMILQRFPS